MKFATQDLEAFRAHGDPFADSVIAEIMKSGDKKFISKLFDKLIKNQDYEKVDLPEEVATYFETTGGLPDWADENKIKVGQDVFAQFGPEICLLLLCKALPLAYSCKKGAEVLYQTGRLRAGKDDSLDRFKRRLMETSQFVLNVCIPEGYLPQGAGLITAQKVRLIHAAIRYYIQQTDWNVSDYGVPINQEDLAGTLQSFSALIIEGLGQLKIELTNQQIEGYYHCWRIAGHIVGVNDELNPETYEEGLKLGYAILNQQKGESEAGKVLTKAVIEFMESIMPGNLFDDTPEALIRYFVGDETADILGVEKKDGLIARITPKLLGTIFSLDEKLENHSRLFKKISDHVSLKILQGMLNHFNGDKKVHFYIPPSLQENWKLNVSWDHYRAISPSIGKYRLAIEKKKSGI